LQFIGERENAKGKLLERSFPLDSFQELLKKHIDKYNFLKVLGILKPFFQEGFKRGSGAEPLVLRSPTNPNLKGTPPCKNAS
jgi:hypothetical protein